FAAVVAFLGLLSVAPEANGAFVELSPSTVVNAHASAGFAGQAGLLPPDVHDDLGDLTDPQAEAQANATLPLVDEAVPADASGAA
ncbi:hypothetical protein, partial [Salmonella sp. SAL4433]|uniref:hypothetical protein n=1 Tax=Salmonella sp. SAL4433 TaxID=3159888 RepID=UPI00397E1C86